jgi:hypothetical protein
MPSTKCSPRRWGTLHLPLDATVADQGVHGEVSVEISQSKECKGIVYDPVALFVVPVSLSILTTRMLCRQRNTSFLPPHHATDWQPTR